MRIQRSFMITDDDCVKRSICEDVDRLVEESIGDNHEARLLLKEAAANCMLHSGGTRFTVTIDDESEHGPVIQVEDDGHGYDFEPTLERARRGDVPEGDVTHGRGIFLIHHYTDGRMDILDRGRRIRFALAA